MVMTFPKSFLIDVDAHDGENTTDIVAPRLVFLKKHVLGIEFR